MEIKSNESEVSAKFGTSQCIPSKDGFARKVQLSVIQDGKRMHKLVLLLAREDTTDQDVIPVRVASSKDNN